MVKKTALLLSLVAVVGVSAGWQDGQPVYTQGYWNSTELVRKVAVENAIRDFNFIITANQKREGYDTAVQTLHDKFAAVFPEASFQKDVVNEDGNALLLAAMKNQSAPMINLLLNFGADPRVIMEFECTGKQNQNFKLMHFFLEECVFFSKLDTLVGKNTTDFLLTGLLIQLFNTSVDASRVTGMVAKMRKKFNDRFGPKPAQETTSDEDEGKESEDRLDLSIVLEGLSVTSPTYAEKATAL